MNKIVSVIMPCFNDGLFIEESISSVMNQTYSNIELIIIDDGSNDVNTIRILNSIDNEKIRILRTNRKGPAAARNKGISESKGEYILPLDSDDIIEKTYIEKAVKIIEKNKNIGIVYCEAEFFGNEKGLWELPNYSLDSMLMGNIIFVTALFRKNDWEIVHGFDETYIYGLEDYDFWLSIIELNRDVYKIPETLFYYRIKENSRNKSFELKKENVKKTYTKIYLKHKNLYMNNVEILIQLKNELIEAQYSKLQILKVLNKIPVVGLAIRNNKIKRIIKNILNKSII